MISRADLERRVAELEAEKSKALAEKIAGLEYLVKELEANVAHYRQEAYRNAEIGRKIAEESEAEIRRIRAIAEGKGDARMRASGT